MKVTSFGWLFNGFNLNFNLALNVDNHEAQAFCMGRERKQHKTFLSLDTLKKIEARKKVKENLNHSRTRAKKAEARIRYSEVNKEVKRNIRNDRRNFVEDLARREEEASGRGDAKELYSITRKLAGDRKISDRPVREKSGDLLTDQ